MIRLPTTAMMTSTSVHCISVRNGINSSMIVILSRQSINLSIHATAFSRVYNDDDINDNDKIDDDDDDDDDGDDDDDDDDDDGDGDVDGGDDDDDDDDDHDDDNCKNK